ncbi:hypothetical protein Mapa_006416 [Marchantia paleacea]|nr:hypothetical protein Mapa_006416 [Marchantia paleacea]
MISVKRLCDNTGNQFYLVESRLPDGKLQCITRSFKFMCNARGFEDADARAKALRFAITTDTLVQFRAFIFSEQDAASALGRTEGCAFSGSPRLDAFLALGSSPESVRRRGIRSYICMRQNRLTGLRFVVAMSRLENGRLRAVSFQDHSLVGGGIPDEAYEALNKAVRFLRGVAFESWRKQNVNDLTSRNRETFGHRRERALKHVSAFVEIETGEKVDCACGKNRSRGLMVACERCGAWEHAECQGFRSDKQIPADYICSACMRADREDVVVIRLDEQGECGNLQLEDLWTDAKIRDREGVEPVCCVCGCEDNQDFESMIHPVTEHACEDGAAFAHPACVSAAQHLSNKAWTRQATLAGLCQICGERFLKSPKDELLTSSGVSSVKTSLGSTSPNTSSQARSSRRAAKTDQTSRKRLRSALTNGGVVAKADVEKRPFKNIKEEESDGHPSQSGDKTDSAGVEANKVGTTLFGRRFSDAAVTVPIKKRKFQMLEVPRSPSPPPKSPSPSPQVGTVAPKGEQSDQTVLSSKGEVGQCSEDAEMLEGGSLDTEAVTGAGAHALFSVLESKGDCGMAISGRKLVYPQSDASDLVARHDSEVSGATSEVIPFEKGAGSSKKGSDSSLTRRLTATQSRVSLNVSDTARGSEESRYSRAGHQDDHHPGKGRLKSGEKSKLSENGRPQHDNAPSLHGQQSRPLDSIQHDTLHGPPRRSLNVTEVNEALKQPSVQASAGAISPDFHQSAGLNEPISNRSPVTVDDVREFQGRHLVDDASRSSDLASSDPTQAISVVERDFHSDDKCEKEVSMEREMHHENLHSGDADVKDVARSSSASQGPSRDARLHWDLNMDMEEWERPPEEDTGTFTGVGLGFGAQASNSNDTNVERVQKVVADDSRPDVPLAQPESAKVIAEVVLEELSNEEGQAVEVTHFEGECDVSSNDAGGVGLKCLAEGSDAIDSGNGNLSAERVSDQHAPNLVAVEAVEVESKTAKVPVGGEESSPKKQDDSKDVVGSEHHVLPADDDRTGGEQKDEIVLLKNAVEVDVKDDVVAKLDVEQEVKVVAELVLEYISPTEGQCSASTSAVEVGGKSSSDADFPGKFEANKVKASPEESLQAIVKSLDDVVNDESNIHSADNYDFVEYDGSDYEAERASDAEKAVPDKAMEEPQTAEFAQAESPREWNEGHIEEMEAEHVDYDDSADSRDGEELGSDADERADGEWRGSVATRQQGEVEGPIKAERNGQSSPTHVEKGAHGEVSKTALEIQDNLQLDVEKESTKVSDVECLPTETKSVAGGQSVESREPEDAPSLERHGGDDKAVHRENADAKFVENAHTREEKRLHEDKDLSAIAVRRGDGQSRTKSSGWDQLPEGFDNPDDALRAAKGNPVVRTGRGSPWGSTNGRGASISPRGGPVTSRFGRGLRTDSIGDRARSEDSWTRDDHQHGLRGDDTLDISPRLASPRELGRGRTHGRGGSPVVRARGRIEPWMDSPSGPTSPWGPNRHPSPPGRYNDGVGFGPRGPTNAAAVAAAKVESSGFVVAPDGTVTKAGSSSRGPPRPFQTGGRNGRGVMFNMGRGGPGMGMAVGMNLGGIRVSMGRGMGMGMGPGMGMNMGIGMGIGMGVGPGLGLGLPGRGGPGGRGMDVRYTGPYTGRGSGGSPLVEGSSSSRRGRSHEEYPDNWSRREERSVSPRKRRSPSRRSRSRTHSRSRSRTRSPRGRTPPRPTNSSGSGGGVVDKSTKKRSHSPAAHKPELKIERVESPPARRSVPPPPKLPLPPPPPRSQRSPPAGLKRLSDSKRDGDRARSRDRERERERPTTRARTPPRRTSPHVVHGSALMDDRDRQLLAGIRHVSPAGGRHRSTENAGAAAAGSTRDSPPLTSPSATLARVPEGNSEARRQSGDEGGDSKVHGPRREETGPKVEQRSSKDTSRGERERSSRRDGGRDRDEERRDASKMSYSSRDRDGRGSSSMKYNREGDDDVAPRRRRPSP